MLHTTSFSIDGMTVSLETGKVAQQADGAIWLTCQDTVLLGTATSTPQLASETKDFLALTVHYQEKLYAIGKIAGNHNKRQGKRTDKETLTARRTDRSIRPLFAPSYRANIDVTVEALSACIEASPQEFSVLAASTALLLSDLPFFEPVGAIRIIREQGKLSTYFHGKQNKKAELDLFVAGTQDDILMVEGFATLLPEAEILEAIAFAHQKMQPMLKAQIELQKLTQTDKESQESPLSLSLPDYFESHVFTLPSKQQREAARKQYRRHHHTAKQSPEPTTEKKALLQEQEKQLIKSFAIHKKKRLDARKPNELRNIICEEGILPRTHGSALFTREETQVLVVATLGGAEDEKNNESLHGMERKQFYLHYNFPHYATGETGRFGNWGRRELGHGHFAERALAPVIPTKKKFPYTINLTAEVLSANGSSSMATVSGGTIALLSAGVPISEPIAGTSVALFSQGGETILLSDPLGEEDYLGDMDLKLCGGREGITAIHMDLKMAGISLSLLEKAMQQAKQDRQHILAKIDECLSQPRELSPYAPQVASWQMPPSVAKTLLGQGGKALRKLKEKSGAKIVVNPKGSIRITAPNRSAIAMIKEFLNQLEQQDQEEKASKTKPEDIPETLKIDAIYEGTITHIKEYGTFVKLTTGETGLIHTSEYPEMTGDTESQQKRNIGETLQVRLISINKQGKLGFSLRPLKKD